MRRGEVVVVCMPCAMLLLNGDESTDLSSGELYDMQQGAERLGNVVYIGETGHIGDDFEGDPDDVTKCGCCGTTRPGLRFGPFGPPDHAPREIQAPNGAPLTVGQPRGILAEFGDDVQIVIATDTFYTNVGSINLPDNEGYNAITLNPADTFDPRQF